MLYFILRAKACLFVLLLSVSPAAFADEGIKIEVSPHDVSEASPGAILIEDGLSRTPSNFSGHRRSEKRQIRKKKGFVLREFLAPISGPSEGSGDEKSPR